jgi:hypothetical protein
MPWHRLDATDGLDEHLVEDCWRLCKDLTCSGQDADHGCAIFDRVSGDRRSLFFAPALCLLAEKLGAQPCARPSPDGLILVYGEAAAWRTLFGELDGAQVELFESTYRLAL